MSSDNSLCGGLHWKKKLKPLIKFVEKEMEKANKYRVKEDEDRRKYIEAMKAEEAKKANNTKDDFNTTTKT